MVLSQNEFLMQPERRVKQEPEDHGQEPQKDRKTGKTRERPCNEGKLADNALYNDYLKTKYNALIKYLREKNRRSIYSNPPLQPRPSPLLIGLRTTKNK